MYTWDRLAKLPDKYVVDMVNESFQLWQDWFWGNYEQWPTREIPIWVDRYNATEAVIDKAKSETEVLQQPPKQQPVGPVVNLPPEYVYGRLPPKVEPVQPGRGIVWTIAAILATIFLSKSV